MIIKAITDNQGKTFDRYTVYFWDGSYLTLSHNCDSPQGVSMWGESHNIPHGEFQQAVVTGSKINDDETVIDFEELPGNVQKHIVSRLDD